MREYVTCPTCGSYVQLEDLRAPCQLCGADMCVRCAKECQECGKEICRDCYRGKGLCKQCSNIASISRSWNKATKGEGDLDPIIGGVGTFIDIARTARDYGNTQKERRENEIERKRLGYVQEYKDVVYRFIRNNGSVDASTIAEKFKLSEQTVYLILDELEMEGKIT